MQLSSGGLTFDPARPVLAECSDDLVPRDLVHSQSLVAMIGQAWRTSHMPHGPPYAVTGLAG
jgi:hypothetical protein